MRLGTDCGKRGTNRVMEDRDRSPRRTSCHQHHPLRRVVVVCLFFLFFGYEGGALTQTTDACCQRRQMAAKAKALEWIYVHHFRGQGRY